MSAGLAGWCALGRCAKCPGADCECECHPGRESAAVPTEAGTGAGAVAVQVRTPLRVLGATASTRAVVTAGVPLVSGRVVDLAGTANGTTAVSTATLAGAGPTDSDTGISRSAFGALVVEAAHAYAARGWPVVILHGLRDDGQTCTCDKGAECRSTAKHPEDSGWPALNVTPAVAERRLRGGQRNVGIITGERSGLLVLDIDPKDDGPATLAALEQIHSVLPTTRLLRSGSGGHHQVFRHPADEVVSNSAGKLGRGLDIRTTGGQIVVAPSRTNKGTYAVERDIDPVDPPHWLIDLLRKPAPIEPISAAGGWAWATAECPWMAAKVKGWPGDSPRDGNWHKWLLSQATKLAAAHRFGCLTDTGYSDARTTLAAMFVAGLSGEREPDRGEIDRALASGVEYAERKTDAEVEAELGHHTHAVRQRTSLGIGDPFADETWTAEPPTDEPAGGEQDAPPLRNAPPDVLARTCPVCKVPPGTECVPAGWVFVDGGKWHLSRVPPLKRSGPKAAPDADFWDAREWFGYVRALARDRLTSPYAVLGEVLLRVAACTPPGVMLPPLRGGPASLNLFVALVGPSGSGKDTARDVAGEIVTGARSDPRLGIGSLADVGANPYEDDPFGGGFRSRFIIRTPGSGEGIPGLFGRSEKVKGTSRYQVIRSEPDSVMMEVSELDMLLALGARSGATILPVLRTAYNGKLLGFTNRDGATTIPIAAHTYRLTVSVGVQPLRAQPLLDDADGGLPQRFLWLPTHDPSGRAWREQGHPTPERRPPWEPPSFAGTIELAVPEVVREAVIEAAMPLAELVAVNPLDGHAVLAREKVAALLGILDGRPEVSVEDWQLAGHLMDVSDRERASVQAILTTKAVEDGERRARTAGKHAVIVDDTKHAAGVRRLAQRTAERLRVDGGWVGGAKIRKWAAGRDREYVEDALRSLVAAAVVDSKPSDGAGSAGLLYRVRS